MTLTVNHLMNTLKNSHKFDRVMKDIVLKVLKEGKCVAEMKVGEEHTNPIGGLHGGCSATLVDNISSYALLSHGKGAVASVSVDMHMTYIKGAKVGDTLKIEGRTMKVEKMLAFLEDEITNIETGHLLFKGSRTFFLSKL
ncbi:unnamed protein product [Acanthoscelides obtectus]|uniref:Acyl-coenzyme A thioesterase 13 n=1 Tax=Acanthoscelides obtectus TaxID=200917 RepID=A0A9P0PSP8_ACAOB|nr:unnamed protein product [Acanthoscelides obtectus]CAK1663890.1 Acyl-coenzyme A thioesterase 13 [Acanthoscelides obtectus]